MTKPTGTLAGPAKAVPVVLTILLSPEILTVREPVPLHAIPPSMVAPFKLSVPVVSAEVNFTVPVVIAGISDTVPSVPIFLLVSLVSAMEILY